MTEQQLNNTAHQQGSLETLALPSLPILEVNPKFAEPNGSAQVFEALAGDSGDPKPPSYPKGSEVLKSEGCLDIYRIRRGTLVQFDLQGFTGAGEASIAPQDSAKITIAADHVNTMGTVAAQQTLLGTAVIDAIKTTQEKIALINDLLNRHAAKGVMSLEKIEEMRVTINETIRLMNLENKDGDPIFQIGNEGDMGRFWVEDPEDATKLAVRISAILQQKIKESGFDTLSFRVGVHTIDPKQNEVLEVFVNKENKVVSVTGSVIPKINFAESSALRAHIAFSNPTQTVVKQLYDMKATKGEGKEELLNIKPTEFYDHEFEMPDVKPEKIIPKPIPICYGKVDLPGNSRLEIDLLRIQRIILECGLEFIKFNTIKSKDDKLGVSFIVTSGGSTPTATCIASLEKLSLALTGLNGVFAVSYGNARLDEKESDILSPNANAAARGAQNLTFKEGITIAIDAHAVLAITHEGYEIPDGDRELVKAKGMKDLLEYRRFYARANESILEYQDFVKGLEPIEFNDNLPFRIIELIHETLKMRGYDEIVRDLIITTILQYTGFAKLSGSADFKEQYLPEQFHDAILLTIIALGSSHSVNGIKPSFPDILNAIAQRVHCLKYPKLLINSLDDEEKFALLNLSTISLGRVIPFNFETPGLAFSIKDDVLNRLRNKGVLLLLHAGKTSPGRWLIRPPLAQILDSTLSREEIKIHHTKIVRAILPRFRINQGLDYEGARVLLLHAMNLDRTTIETLSVATEKVMTDHEIRTKSEDLTRFIAEAMYQGLSHEETLRLTTEVMKTQALNRAAFQKAIDHLTYIANLLPVNIDPINELESVRNIRIIFRNAAAGASTRNVTTISIAQIVSKIQMLRNSLSYREASIVATPTEVELKQVVAKAIDYAIVNEVYPDIAMLGPNFIHLMDDDDQVRLMLATGKSLIAVSNLDSAISVLNRVLDWKKIVADPQGNAWIGKYKAEAQMYLAIAILTRNHLTNEKIGYIKSLRESMRDPILLDHRLEILSFLQRYNSENGGQYGLSEDEQLLLNYLKFGIGRLPASYAKAED